jgi:hypothetical protein
MKIARHHLIAALALVAAACAILLAMGRPPICSCGTIELWHGALDAGNSQHLADWYTPSHIIHGFIFYALGWALLRSRPIGERMLLAIAIEAGWEVLENSPMIIDRYRQATIALGYSGDSVINSLADIGCMTAGFLLARTLPVAATIALAAGFELLTLWLIRDNLALNALMLLWPIESVRLWQGG